MNYWCRNTLYFYQLLLIAVINNIFNRDNVYRLALYVQILFCIACTKYFIKRYIDYLIRRFITIANYIFNCRVLINWKCYSRRKLHGDGINGRCGGNENILLFDRQPGGCALCQLSLMIGEQARICQIC